MCVVFSVLPPSKTCRVGTLGAGLSFAKADLTLLQKLVISMIARFITYLLVIVELKFRRVLNGREAIKTQYSLVFTTNVQGIRVSRHEDYGVG